MGTSEEGCIQYLIGLLLNFKCLDCIDGKCYVRLGQFTKKNFHVKEH